jgi:hypothetical protein
MEWPVGLDGWIGQMEWSDGVEWAVKFGFGGGNGYFYRDGFPKQAFAGTDVFAKGYR